MNPGTENSNLVQHHLDQAYFYYEETEEFEKALLECDAVLRLDPYLAEAHNLCGIVLEELGRIFQARKAYRQAISFAPDFVEAKDNLAALEAELAREVRLITIATFSHPTEAYVLKTKLDAFGIWSFVADDNTVIMNWLYSNAIGGVKLQVKEADVEQAYQLLGLGGQDLEDTADNLDEGDDEACPSCHSMNIYYNRYNMRLIFASWFLSWLWFVFFVGFNGGFAVPFFKRRWKCDDCGYEWKDTAVHLEETQ